MTAEYWIKKLELMEHPEGGYFRETYRSGEELSPDDLPDRYDDDHRFSTSIYFLVTHERPSRLHRLISDEIWHFYEGSSLTLHLIHEGGTYEKLALGRDAEAGEAFQRVVPRGTWFGATVDEPGGYALVGCTVAPGFEFGDFELGGRSILMDSFPEHRGIIEELTGSEES